MGEVDTVLTEIPFLLQENYVESERVLLAAEWLLRDVVAIEELLPHSQADALVTAVSDVVSCVQAEVDRRRLRRRRGRPMIEVPEDQLETLLEYRFSTTDIARMLNVSTRTIRRRVLQYGLESYTSYSDNYYVRHPTG